MAANTMHTPQLIIFCNMMQLSIIIAVCYCSAVRVARVINKTLNKIVVQRSIIL